MKMAKAREIVAWEAQEKAFEEKATKDKATSDPEDAEDHVPLQQHKRKTTADPQMVCITTAEEVPSN